MSFVYSKGCLFLSIEPEYINQYLKEIPEMWQLNRSKRDGTKYHITIVKSTEDIPETLPNNENYYIVGLKKTNNIAFLVVHYPAGDKFRKKHNLDTIDFHISLGWAKNDDHTICKSIKCLDKDEIINKTFYDFFTINEKQYEIMTKLYYDFPLDSNILASYIDCLVKNQEWEKAKLLSYTLLDMCPNKGTFALLKLNLMFNTIDTKLLETIEEKLLGVDINNNIKEYNINKIKNYNIEKLNYALLLNSNALVSKYEWMIKDNKYYKLKMPRNCTEPYKKIFGSAVLKNTHLEFIKYKNIDCVINLTEKHESEIDQELINYFGKNYYKYPIPDRSIITMENTEIIIDKMIEYYDNDKNILVHCMGGKGRTNMIISCFAIKKFGLQFSEINELLKTTREYVLSKEQIDFIKKYEHKLMSNEDFNKKDKSFIKFNGKKCPKMIILVGLPGSGKSTFSNHIINNVKSTIRISQDDIGKKACYDVISKNISNNNLILIDRCNLKAEDRKDFYDYLKQDQKAWAIVFNTEPEECIYRAQHRPEHPTLKPTSAEKIIKDLYLTYEPVLPNENFEQIIQIKSPDDLNFILEQWSIPLIKIIDENANDIIKFPRTRHLANIGGASREDLLLEQNDINQFLTNEIFIEEKIDGANMGISIEPETYKILFQNRSHYVTPNYAAQFKKLDIWRDTHQSELYEILEPGRHILYGEWVFSKHSIHYTNLPDYFIAFDLFDKKTGKFCSRNKLEELLKNTTIQQIKLVTKGKFKNIDQIIKLVNSNSEYYSGKLEGVYVRICDENYTLKRAKIVRNDFICGDTHWSKNKCTENLIKNN